MTQTLHPMILIIEDNPNVAVSIKSAITLFLNEINQKWSINTANSVEEARDFLISNDPPDLVIVDMEILHNGKPEMPAGYYLIQEFINHLSKTEWIAITGHRMLTLTQVGEKSLADALFEVPLLGIWYKDDFNELISYFRSFYQKFEPSEVDFKLEPRFLVDLGNGSFFATNDGQLYFQIRQAASREENVFLFGPKGTQKELIAQSIHLLSIRKEFPFAAFDHLSIDCEKFDNNSLRVLKQLRGGTIFINNFDLLSETCQHKLAQQCGKVTGYDIRLFSGVDREDKSTSGLDFSSENSFISVTIPPLSERASDIPLLVSLFLKEYNSKSVVTKTFIEVEKIVDFLQSCTFPENANGVKRLVDYVTNLKPSKLISCQDIVSAYHNLFGLFGRVEVDEMTNEIIRAGKSLTKQPSEMEFKLLRYLIKNDGRVCTKEEIIKAVWTQDVQSEGVSDEALSQLIKRLRDLIEIDPGIHRYIRTFRGKGYQFVQYKPG